MSNQALTEEIKSVVFDNDQLEIREISIPKAFLLSLVNQDSNSDAGKNFL